MHEQLGILQNLRANNRINHDNTSDARIDMVNSYRFYYIGKPNGSRSGQTEIVSATPTNSDTNITVIIETGLNYKITVGAVEPFFIPFPIGNGISGRHISFGNTCKEALHSV